MNEEILTKAKHWANHPLIDSEDQKEIQKLIDENDEKELTERFYKGLEFGTGGMRSILGAGINRINKYTIRKATQALCNVIIKETSDESQRKIAISYDSRNFSYEFACEAASVCAANGVRVFIYKHLNPVALLSYSVRHHGAKAGIMVTASHNPPEYNGYKVYWEDGAQVTPPQDQMIIDEYNSIGDLDEVKLMSFDDALKKELISWSADEVEDNYYENIKKYVIDPKMCADNGDKLSIVYTPIHGTGLGPCKRALTDAGFNNVAVVESQAEPDGSFPTVTSPNPENPEALALAVELMNKNGADIVMGSDPDTDRLGVAIPHQGEIHYINGNQLGVLMLHYILKQKSQAGTLPSNPYFVKTVVTTPLQEKVAASFNVDVENTLTGFKWICGRMRKIETESPERNFLFATEESFGYLNHSHVRDKDGVSSVSLMAEVTLHYKLQGLNLIEALDKIYEEYGFAHDQLLNLVFKGKEGSEKIGRIMELWRSSICTEASLLDEEIALIEDYQKGTVFNKSTGKEEPLNFPKSNVLGIHWAGGNRLYLRPSGTEPKIKFYLMINENDGTLDKRKSAAKERAQKVIDFIEQKASQA
jgi:phosphoglucomutase